MFEVRELVTGYFKSEYSELSTCQKVAAFMAVENDGLIFQVFVNQEPFGLPYNGEYALIPS